MELEKKKPHHEVISLHDEEKIKTYEYEKNRQ